MHHAIILDVENETYRPLAALLEQIIPFALAQENVALPCEINVLLTNDAQIQEINRDMRGIDRATDVLSFPMFELTPAQPPDSSDFLDPETRLCPLGDMVISMDRVAAQAQEYGHTQQREFCYLVVHSMLHLLGYDHLDEGAQKKLMRKREEEILTAFGAHRE